MFIMKKWRVTVIWLWALLVICTPASAAHKSTTVIKAKYPPTDQSRFFETQSQRAMPSNLVRVRQKVTQVNTGSGTVAELNPEIPLFIESRPATMTSELPCDVTTLNVFDVVVNCSGRNLTEVPRDLPKNVTSLDLSFNVIKRLTVTSFAGLSSLVSLNLTGNRLSYMALPSEVFHNMTSLRVLLMTENTDAHAIPQQPGSEAPWPLFSLTDLSFDLLPDVDFDARFSELRSLTTLTINMVASVKLTNTTFRGFARAPVKKLYVHNKYANQVFGVETEAFSYFPSLVELNMAGVFGQNMNDTYTIMRDFQGRNMSVLNFSSFARFYRRKIHARPVVTIDEKLNTVLCTICVKKLLFSDNNIMYFDLASLLQGRFKDCIEHLDLSQNPLQGPINVFLLLYRFSALKYVDFSPKPGFCQNSLPNGDVPFRIHVTFPLPRSLEYIDISSVFRIGNLPRLRFIGGENVVYLNLSCNALTHVNTIQGLGNLQTLDLSYNEVNATAPDFFDNFPELRTLVLRSASLNQTWLLSWGERYFRSLSKVTHMDVSGNALQLLPRTSFPSLSSLVASGNAFTQVPVSLESRPTLRFLDLSHNAITVLPPLTRQQLDALASQQPLTLLLRGNPLSCDCSSLDFLEWLRSTSVQLDEGRNYVCVGPDGMSNTTAQMFADLDRMWYKCHGPTFLLASASLTTAWLMTMVLTFFVVKFKTNLQHLLLRMAGLGRPKARRLHFQYDVYVAFSLEDDDDRAFVFRVLRQRLEGQAGLRLFLRGRDDQPGSHVAESILEGLDMSWRVIFVLTPAFLRDPWCDFMVSTAVRSTPHVIPDRLLLLLLQPLNRADLPRRLLDAVDEDVIYDVTNADSRAAVLARVCHRL